MNIDVSKQTISLHTVYNKFRITCRDESQKSAKIIVALSQKSPNIICINFYDEANGRCNLDKKNDPVQCIQ